MQQQVAFLCFSAVLLALTQIVASEDVKRGGCPSGIKTVENFNATAYLGLWYEHSRYPFIFEDGGRCITAEYGALSSGEVSVLNSQISESNEKKTIQGTATVEGPGKLAVRFDGFAGLAGAADYWVLATDYKQYAVVYSCRSLVVAHIEYLWVLTREQDPSEEVLTTATDVIVAQNLSLDPLKETDQSNCV